MDTRVALLIAAALPAVLLAVFGIFRWRYIRLIERTIRTGLPELPLAAGGDAVDLDHHPRVALESHPPVGAVSEPAAVAARAAAQRHAAAIHRAFLLASLVFTVTSAAIVWWRQSAAVSQRAAIALAFYGTLPPLFLAIAFARPRGRTWLIAAAAWLAAGFLLLVGPLRVPWRVASSLMLDGISFSSFALVCIVPLALRTIRALLVGFVPLVVFWIAITTVAGLILAAFGLDLAAGFTARAALLGLLAAATGVAVAAAGIRRRAVRSLIVLSTATFIAGAVAGWASHFALVTAAISGIGFNALLTVAVWWAFRGFLRLKSRGVVPDDLLHLGLCWVTLTVFVGIFTRTESASQVPLVLTPVVASTTMLVWQLWRQRRRRPSIAHKRLLLLRVFGAPSARRRLLDLLDESWRHVGSVDIVVGVDVAVQTLGAVALQDFLLGRIDRQVVTSTADLDARADGTPRAALDGRYPVNEFLCLANVWQTVVARLADAADVVLMDLRGFQASNGGAAFELSLIVQRVPLSKIVLMMDDGTDAGHVAGVVNRAWAARPPLTPNREQLEPRIAVVEYRRRSDANEDVLRRVFAAAYGAEPATQPA
jgi:hypothetical protein